MVVDCDKVRSRAMLFFCVFFFWRDIIISVIYLLASAIQ